ncbi:MAG: hypothetical protein CFK52_05640 [Chloracidobacterium sp. CP2_5A]|nr:MAG: hypothetical protein CFK52_05640 [Chloracidobacterium sp. CP2_5A]
MRAVIRRPKWRAFSVALLVLLGGLFVAQADMAGEPRATFEQTYTLTTTNSMRALADLRPMRALPAGDAPIAIEGLPTLMRVGDTRTVTFRFAGDGVSARLAGALLFESFPTRDAIYYSAGKILADRSRLSSVLDVDMLPSGAANEVAWRVTARRAGVAGVLAVCASRVPDGPVASQLAAIRVIASAEEANTLRPGVVTEPPPAHLPLYVGERVTWTGFARSLAGRLPVFDFAALSLDAGCLEGAFSNSSIALQAVSPGRALVIGALGDERAWSPFATLVEVSARPAATEPRLRGFVNNFVTLKNRRVTALGDQLDRAMRVSLLAEDGAFLSLPFRAWSSRLGMFELPPRLGRYTVWLTDEQGQQITAPQTVICSNIQVTNLARVRASAKSNAPTIGLFARGQGLGDTPTLIVNGVETQAVMRKSLRGLFNQRVYFRLPAETLRESYVSVQVMNPDGYVSDTYLLDLRAGQ